MGSLLMVLATVPLVTSSPANERAIRAGARLSTTLTYDGKQIHVTRSIWEGHVSEPKTSKSKASVDVIAPLAAILEGYRAQCGSADSGPMFASQRATSLNLNNVLNRQILPAINRCIDQPLH
jgi:hypothetical protein